jgi:hypothetical protein
MTEHLLQEGLIWRQIHGLPGDCLTTIINTIREKETVLEKK